MKTPSFWSSPSLLSLLLLPLANLYETASVLRRALIKPVTLPIPVICIGGLTAGGAGKTPVALAIGKKLKARGIAAFYLSRGYGGTLTGPLLVDMQKHTAQAVGDEPLLLATVLPTIVSVDRVRGAQLAMKKGARAIIMDDGFQNPSLAKTLSLLVIDGERGFGNGRLIPAGPLREVPQQSFARAHALIVINRTNLLPPLPEDRPVLAARTEPMPEAVAVRSKKVIAFCGIAYPDKFFSMLKSLGAELVETIPFPDHYAYKSADIALLTEKARRAQAPLVTTAKDAVRLPPEFRKLVAAVDISLVFENEAVLDALLDYALTHAKA